MKERFILAEYPVVKGGRIVLNKEYPSREIGVKNGEKILGSLTPVKIPVLDGWYTFQAADGKQYIACFGEHEKRMLARLLVDGMAKKGLIDVE